MIKYICILSQINNRNDCRIKGTHLTDLNKDGYKELVFAVNAGFAMQPRRVYAYDIRNNIILKSPKSGANINSLTYLDIDNDAVDEILLNTGSPSNIHDSLNIPFSDNFAWLMILDNDLNFLFEPVRFEKSSTLALMPYFKDDNTLILGHYHNPIETDKATRMYIFDLKGNIIQSEDFDIKSWHATPDFSFTEKKSNYSTVYYIVSYNGIYEYGHDLGYKKKVCNLETEVYQPLSLNDIDKDGEDEILIYSFDNQSLLIYKEGFKEGISLHVPNIRGNIIALPINSKDFTNHFTFQIGGFWFLIKYTRNPKYYMKYLLYLLIFISFSVFILFIKYIQKKQLQKNIETEKRINELQLVSLKSQMNPHFTFNALNSVSSVIYKEDKETAYNFFTKFSKLVRSTLISSDKISITLKEEIDFFTNYLELEKFRFKEKFHYEIEIAEDIDQNLLIPKMCIQTFVENSIKHGLMHSDRDWLLEINIQNKNKAIEIKVKDNGIGREKANEISSSGTGKGLEIMTSVFDLYKKLNGKHINFKIIDLKDNETALGTEVIIRIPI